MELLLQNKVTKDVTIFTGLTDLCTSALFYQFNIALPLNMIDGQYDYQLKDDDTVLATGVVQIGDFVPQVDIYKNNKTYTVYNG